MRPKHRHARRAWVGLLVVLACTGSDDAGTTAPTYRISGAVSGAAQAGVTITLSGAAALTTTTDGAGNYEFDGVASGAYTVTPGKPDFVFSPASVAVTVTNASVTGNDFTAIEHVVDREWASWPITSVSPPDSAYHVDAAGGTVTDSVTCLMWQRTVATTAFDWQGAKSYCASLVLGAGSSGWRLPTIIELLSLVHYGRAEPAINVAAFPETPAKHFWSSTPDHSLADRARAVNFETGESTVGLVTNGGRVRCVRSSLCPR